jgi:hypothetical protein
MEPLILTVGKLRSVLDGLVQQCEARGRRVLGATSDDELRALLENREAAAVVLGGGLPEPDRARYREIIGSLRPELPIHQHSHGGPAGLIEVVDRVAQELKG